ncbi:MAG: C69 family dipeptidase [Actinobacteria bacterium]|nr:C69 family dipeptidase [Actinomycetota bacterium]
MCDTLVAIGRDRTLFAKNSDRPVGEVQLVEAYPARAAGADLATQYLTISDAGAAPLVGSRPEWLWGFEHGVNAHRVAIGNEKVWTVDDPFDAPPALIGMDLVRLGLERGRTAREALDRMTSLLDQHGQGGVGDATTKEPYWSSFLVADPASAWILETSGSRWAASPVEDGAAISNRISLPEFDAVRNPLTPTGHADRRLEVTRACVATGAAALAPADLARTMRDHGSDAFPPEVANPVTGEGVSVCMHVRHFQATTASMICELPADPAAPLRAWFALGSPCTSVYVPTFPGTHPVPEVLGKPDTWHRFDALRARVEADPAALVEVRSVLDPLENELWEEADATRSVEEVETRLNAALARLA